MRIGRRSLLASFLAPAMPSPLVAQPVLEPTPACGTAAELTAAQTEGPYFKPQAPMRHDLAGDVREGQRITLAGFVMDRQCRPLAGAIVQLWHADARGQYDNQGFTLRGWHHSDAAGRWWFETIIPAIYPGRTRHYHLKAQRADGSILTTQLYFPDEPLNTRDRLFNPRLLMTIRDAADGLFARYDLVV